MSFRVLIDYLKKKKQIQKWQTWVVVGFSHCSEQLQLQLSKLEPTELRFEVFLLRVRIHSIASRVQVDEDFQVPVVFNRVKVQRFCIEFRCIQSVAVWIVNILLVNISIKKYTLINKISLIRHRKNFSRNKEIP